MANIDYIAGSDAAAYTFLKTAVTPAWIKDRLRNVRYALNADEVAEVGRPALTSIAKRLNNSMKSNDSVLNNLEPLVQHEYKQNRFKVIMGTNAPGTYPHHQGDHTNYTNFLNSAGRRTGVLGTAPVTPHGEYVYERMPSLYAWDKRKTLNMRLEQLRRQLDASVAQSAPKLNKPLPPTPAATPAVAGPLRNPFKLRAQLTPSPYADGRFNHTRPQIPQPVPYR